MTTLRLRIPFQNAMIGPGKAELLERVRDIGSIAAAGRQMQMSYKRAWMLVEEMNRAFQEPLIVSTRGRAKGGGAQLTEAGARVLGLYHDILATAQRAAAPSLETLEAMLRSPAPDDIAHGK